MATTILMVDHYDALRALIAPDVTVLHIPDTYLSQDPFAPKAERKIRNRLRGEGVDVDVLTGDALSDARLAMMHECMTVLCLTVPQMLRYDELEVTTTVQAIDWKEKQAFHRSEVEGLVASVIVAAASAKSDSSRTRALPFGAVGTQRPEKGESAYPYRRR